MDNRKYVEIKALDWEDHEKRAGVSERLSACFYILISMAKAAGGSSVSGVMSETPAWLKFGWGGGSSWRTLRGTGGFVPFRPDFSQIVDSEVNLCY